MELQRYLSNLPSQAFAFVRQQLSEQLGVRARDHGEVYQVMFSDGWEGPDELRRVVDDCVGTVLEKDTNRIVAYSFPLTHEVIIGAEGGPKQQEWETELREGWDSGIEVHPYVEGSKLMLYFYGGRWRLSTNRVLDAVKAFWQGDTSFGTEFLSVCAARHPMLHAALAPSFAEPAPDGTVQADQHAPSESQDPSTIDNTLCYTFILSSPQNQTVTASPAGEATILHVSTYDPAACAQVERDIEGVPHPAAASTFATYDELSEAVLGSSFWHPGFIAEKPSAGVRYKLLNGAYVEARKLRGNTPSLQQRYLELRADPETLQKLYEFFPDARALTAPTERALRRLGTWLHSVYIAYFIAKERPYWDKPVFVAIQQVHAGYRQTGAKRTVRHVYDHVLSLPADIQFRLLRIDAARTEAARLDAAA